MRQYQSTEEKAFRKARKYFFVTAFKMLVFGGLFCWLIIWIIMNGLLRSGAIIHPSNARFGPYAPAAIGLAFTGLGAFFGMPDLKQSWREYSDARNTLAVSKQDKARRR